VCGGLNLSGTYECALCEAERKKRVEKAVSAAVEEAVREAVGAAVKKATEEATIAAADRGFLKGIEAAAGFIEEYASFYEKNPFVQMLTGEKAVEARNIVRLVNDLAKRLRESIEAPRRAEAGR
jgi:hypothetical protein